MRTELITQSKPTALTYLARIGELDAEVQLAMEAIGANALATLEQSVSRQQVLCAELQRLAGEMPRQAAGSAGGAQPPIDASLAHRIELAGESLAALNQRYAALLEHSSQSVRLFAGLCRGYAEHFEPGAQLRAAEPAWSCQV